MGSMEGATEALGGVLVANVGKKIVSKGALEGLKAYGLDIAENFLEESIMEPIQELTKQVIGKNGDWQDLFKRMLQSGIDGALTSIIMSGVSAGVGSAINLANKSQNNEIITQEEIKQTLQDINKNEEIDIEKLLVNSFNFQAEDLMRVTEAQQRKDNRLEKVSQEVSQYEGTKLKYVNIDDDKMLQIENSGLTEFQKNNLLNIANKYDLSEKDIQDLIDNTKNGKYTENQATTMQNNEVINQNEQVILPQDKIVQNGNAEQIETSKDNAEKYNKFKQQMKENGLNYEDTRVNAMFDLPNKRGIDVEVSTELFKKADGSIDSNINAIYSVDAEGKRKIIYNPQANLDSVIEKNTIHEVVHDLEGTKEYSDLSKMVLKKIENTAEFQEAYNSLKEAYSKVTDSEGRILYNKDSAEFENMIKEEAVADYLGENLGNQEYINELVNGKETRNIAQKIYDAIVSFLDKVTGYKSEEAYLRGLKEKFEKAFNAEYTDFGKTDKYSILINSKNQKYVKADRQVISGSNPTEWQKQTRKYINEKIRNGQDVNIITDDGDILTITKNTAGKAQFRNEVLRADGKKTTLSNEELLTKLTAETHIDELAQISTKTNKLPVPDTKNHKFAKDGFDYRRAYFEDFDGQYYKITMSVGKNGSINTIYNIGRLDNLSKKNRSKFSVTAQRPLSQNKTNKENLSSIDSITNSNEDVNTTEYSMQESEKNSGSFSMDNKGRTLTKEQQKYFKDSKVRDEEGHLLELYHRTNADFNIFDADKIASATDEGIWGRGFYFSNKDQTHYGKNLKKVYLDIKNPFIVNDFKSIEDIANYLDIVESNFHYEHNGIIRINYSQVRQFTSQVKEKGHDGVIVEYENGTKEIVAFNPEQIKNVDNTNPTNNEDIRYSQNDGKWQEFLDKNSINEGTKTKLKDIKLPEQKQVNLPTIDNTQEKSKYTPTTKSMNYERKQRNIFKKNMSNMLGISQFNQNNKGLFDVALNQLKTEYNQRGSVSEEVRNDIFNNLYNNLLKEDRAFYDENKEIKDNIRTTKLYVDNKTKTSIVDYDDFRKSTMGSAILTNDDTNMPIDSYYKELNELNPGLFPDNITNTADQLQRIVEVSKSIRKSERNIAEYADEYMSKEYRQYAKQEFDLYVNQLLKEYKIVDRYNQDKIAQNQKEDYVAPDLQEIRTFYENRNALQKEIEKQERNLLLTQREKAVVDRLLKDEMDVNEILPGLNKDAILKSYTARQQLDYLKQEIKKYKSNVKQNLKDIADSLTIDAENWKDKSLGILYSRETATRNMQDIMSRDSADRINKELFEPIIHNTAEQTRFLNEYTDTIDKLNLDKKEKYDWRDSANKPIKIDEATVAQLLIEKKISDEYLKSNNMNVERIHNIADTFEKLLKDTVNRMDDVYVRFGYAPVEKRKNYFPHFLENKPDTFMSKFANAFGFKVGQEDLPTDIAGRTETFKPGRAFDRNILQRTTDKTDYNALKALDMYMQGASDIIYHTEDIQKLRAFNESIRDRFRTSEIQKKLDEINENIELTEEERFIERKKIKDAQKTPLNNLVTWIDKYTNALANKKASADRQFEEDANRQVYTTMKDIEGKIASNLVGGNFSVALTNFAPLSQAMGTTKVGDILIGMIQTTQNSIDEMIKGQGDSFVNESDFLTSRRGNDLAQKERLSQQLSNVVSKPMEIIDNFTSEAIVRAKYRENIKKGMDHNEALKNADNYARNLMADRSKGAMPIVFNRTNPVAKLILSFQIEPNNIISNYFKDMPRDAKINKQNLAFQITKLSVASYAFNTMLKAIRGGGDVIPNPIGIVSQLIELAMSNLDDDDDNDKEVKEVLGNIANDILGCIPGGSAVASVLVAFGVDELQDNGKLMVSSAMPDFTKVLNLFDSSVSNDYKKQVIANELTKPLLYLGLPTGGAQLSKTAKGLYSYVQGASYSYDKDGNKSIQFPVEQTPKNLVQSSIFGKYATDSGKEYVKEFNGMNYKETAVYDKSNIDFNKLKDYFNYSKTKEITKSDKFDYIKTNMANISTEDKWNLFEYNILSSDERDDGTSQVTDAEYAIKNKMATQKEYMNLYEKAEKNNIEFPNAEKLKELKENNLELETYIKYKINLKQEGIQKEKQFENQQKSMLPISEEDRIKSKSLNNTDKINIIKHKIYTEEEKDKIYINEIGKDDDVYTSLKLLNNGGTDRINDYLDYKTADLSSDKKDDGTLKGKTISGSAEAKFKKYIYSSNFRDIEKTYLYGTKYKLDSSQRSALENYIKELDITSEEKNNIYKSLASSNIVEMKDGTIKWKN